MKFTWGGKAEEGRLGWVLAYLVNPKWADKHPCWVRRFMMGTKNLHVFKLPVTAVITQFGGSSGSPFYQSIRYRLPLWKTLWQYLRNTCPLWSSNSSLRHILTYVAQQAWIRILRAGCYQPQTGNNPISISIKMNKLTEVYSYNGTLHNNWKE